MEQVNIIIGRFQPITNGHVRCMEQATAKTGCPTIICMIETTDAKVDERHPFPSSMLVPMYKTLFKGNKNIKDIILVKNANIVAVGEELYKMGYEIRSWVCGTDRVQSYTKMAEKYAEQAHLPENFEVIEIKRGDEDESATKLRQALADDDKRAFFAMFPAIKLSSRLQVNFYEELRKQLLKIKNK